MINRVKQRIISLQEMGFLPRAIANETGLSQTEVRVVLREHWHTRNGTQPGRKKTRKEELAEAKKQMLKAGYDRDVVEANFG